MQWSIAFGGDPQDVTVTTSGEATVDGFAGMNAGLAADARFRPEMLVLVDHTDLVVNELSSADVRTISDDFVRHAAELHSAVVALITPKPLQFGLARMSTTVAEPVPPEIGVFSTRAQALDWLRHVREERG
jgi:hypothetical protein